MDIYEEVYISHFEFRLEVKISKGLVHLVKCIIVFFNLVLEKGTYFVVETFIVFLVLYIAVADVSQNQFCRD